MPTLDIENLSKDWPRLAPESWLSADDALPIAILTAMPAQVAFVAPDGVIRSVNRRWRQTAHAAGGEEACRQTSEGVDYLAVCARSAEVGDESAARAGEGLAAVLSGCSFDRNGVDLGDGGGGPDGALSDGAPDAPSVTGWC